jgi:flagellar export protein FliJ
MKKFEFKLKGLLGLKKALESDVKRQLMEIQAMCRRKEDEIAETGAKIGEWSEHYNQVAFKRVHVAELAVIDRHVQRLYRFKEQLFIGLEILNRKKEDLMAQFAGVRKEVKTLEHLRGKKWLAYQDELRRLEGKEADEMAVLRHARERLIA